jgi:hypothetical protein
MTLTARQWIIGNTFPCVVFGTFGAFWLSFGATLQPFYNSYGAYSTTGVAAEGLKEPMFNASFGMLPYALRLSLAIMTAISSILPSIHGNPLPHLSRLLASHQPGVLHDLLYPRPGILLLGWGLLASCSGQHEYGQHFADRCRRSHVCHLYGRMVDFRGDLVGFP